MNVQSLYSSNGNHSQKDSTVKSARDSNADKLTEYQMPKLLQQFDIAAQISNSEKSGMTWFTSLDLKYSFSQLQLSDIVSSHSKFNQVCGELKRTYRFKTGFYGLNDMPK